MSDRKFRTSNIDLVAYLKTKLIDFVMTEKSKNNNKIMFSYDYDYDELINMQNDFINFRVYLNYTQFKEERNRILDVIKLYN